MNTCFKCEADCQGEFCSQECRDIYSERAHERFLEAFYGGDIATQQELYERSWLEKRQLH